MTADRDAAPFGAAPGHQPGDPNGEASPPSRSSDHSPRNPTSPPQAAPHPAVPHAGSHSTAHSAPGGASGQHGHWSDARIAGTGAPHSLSAALEHELLRVDSGRLRDLHWFRSDWQRGGAATASAHYRDDEGAEHAVIIKVPVTQRELRWTRRLGVGSEAPVAQVWASGDDLGPYDFAWLAIERVQHGPLALHWYPSHVQRIADAAARFHRAALEATAEHGVDQAPQNEDWEALLRTAREHARDPSMPERSRWTTALKDLTKKLDRVIDRWRSRRPIGWIHGDLHPANTMSRVGIEHGPACLIDLAEVRAGHWLEDAIYLERLLWTRPDRLAAKPVKALAEARKRHGLENGDYPPVATARRVLLAATTPAFRGEQSPAFLAASLAKLEEGLHEAR